MYQEEYKRWLAADLEDADLKPELSKIEGNDDEIKERFAVALKFGTAGLRGVLGAGTNRMNIYVVRQATQGLANWVKTQGGTQTVAISYDSRLKSDVFAKTAAGVLAANGINVRIYDALMPVPALSFATDLTRLSVQAGNCRVPSVPLLVRGACSVVGRIHQIRLGYRHVHISVGQKPDIRRGACSSLYLKIKILILRGCYLRKCVGERIVSAANSRGSQLHGITADATPGKGKCHQNGCSRYNHPLYLFQFHFIFLLT